MRRNGAARPWASQSLKGPDGWAPRVAPPIRETVFGRDAGRERAGQNSGRWDRELDRAPGGAGGSGRESEHGQAAEPKPKTPDVDLGM